MTSTTDHDLHDFLKSTQQGIEDEYKRIQKTATEDPGTAGDQGEENWATLLRDWLPSYFQIVTKGRILTASGYLSPQVDVLVLHPSYPKSLLGKKHYLAGGVAAVFECKTTLKAIHVKDAVETAAEIRKHLPSSSGSPYKELVSPITFGLLAHSCSWKGPKSKPIDNVERALATADRDYVSHPIQCIDFITIADLATWTASKTTFISPAKIPFSQELIDVYGAKGSGSSAYVCAARNTVKQEDYFTPIGALLTKLYSKLAWNHRDMRDLEQYFRHTKIGGNAIGRARQWPISIYSDSIKHRVYRGELTNGKSFNEWSVNF